MTIVALLFISIGANAKELNQHQKGFAMGIGIGTAQTIVYTNQNISCEKAVSNVLQGIDFEEQKQLAISTCKEQLIKLSKVQ